jgi:hypothetical protein
MVWTTKIWRIVRGIVLVALLLALLGPWQVDENRYPTAEFPCLANDILLQDGTCGKPFSGMIYPFLALIQMPGFFVTMLLGGMGLRDLLPHLAQAALLLPLLSAAVLLLARGRYSGIGFHAAAVAISISVVLLSDIFSFARQTMEVWGPYVYIAVGVLSVVLEGIMLLVDSRRSGVLLTA